MCWFLRGYIIDRKIAQGSPISKGDGIWILKKAINQHDYFIRITTDDVSVTGDDETHKYWNDNYRGIIYLIQTGDQNLITYDEAIELLEHDAGIHNWWIGHLGNVGPEKRKELLSKNVGDENYHTKWYYRWRSIAYLLKGLNKE